MIVAMRNPDGLVSLTAICGFVEAGVEHVQRVQRLWIGIEPGVIKRPLSQAAIFADLLPGSTGVVGCEYSAFFSLDYCVDSFAVSTGHAYSDFSDHSLWQTFVSRYLCPCVASIGRFE